MPVIVFVLVYISCVSVCVCVYSCVLVGVEKCISIHRGGCTCV